MHTMIHSRKTRISVRRCVSLETARGILQQISNGSLDPWVGYRQVYGVYQGSSGLLEELKPLFRLPGIEPDGCLVVDDAVRETVRTAAAKWLSENSN